MAEPSEEKIKALWQDQQEEDTMMTTQAIRALVRSHGDNVRDRLLMGYAVIVLEAIVFGWYALKAPNPLARVGDLLVLAGLAWMVWRIWLRRPGRLPEPDAPARTLLAFQRTELERRKASYAWMLISAGPMIAGLLVLVAGLRMAHPGTSSAALVRIFVLLAIWFVAGWFIQRRQSQRIQRQIEELDGLGGG